MTKTTAASTASTSRLALGGLAVLFVCLCLGIAGGAAWGYLNGRAPAAEPAVEYVLDASPRMSVAGAAGEETRLVTARAVLAEIVRPADGAVSAALRVFGNGAVPEACRDTELLVPLAPANQSRISDVLGGVQAGLAADAAVAESMIAAIRDLSAVRGPHTLVVVTGGQDSCNPEAGLLIAQEADKAGIELETFVIGYQAPADEAEAIRGMVAESGGGGVYLDAHDKIGLHKILEVIQKHVDDPDTTTVADVIATASAVPATVTPGPTLSVEEAAQIVIDEVVVPDTLDHEIIVFRLDTPIWPSEGLLPFAAPELGAPPEYIDVPGLSWFFWIDDFPAGKFSHPNRFVLVDTATGAVFVSAQKWWPVVYRSSPPWAFDYWNPANWVFSQFDGNPLGFPAVPAPSGQALARPAAAPLRFQSTGNGTALVINGGQPFEPGMNDLALDAASVRAAFIHSGLATTYLGPTTDPNRDGDFSPSAVADWVGGQAGQLVAGDTLLVYLTGHGDSATQAGLSQVQLQDALRPFNAEVHVIVILDGSYSGSFIPGLTPYADRLITATSADLPALFDTDPANDPNAATDAGSEFTSGFVEDWEGILNSPSLLAEAQRRALSESRPLWDVLAEASFHSAVAKDAGAINGRTAPRMLPAVQPTPTPTLTPTPTETPLPPTTTFTPQPPTATFTRPPPTATFTPQPPFVNFTVDHVQVGLGQCTTLRWDSGNIQALFLDGQGVAGKGTRDVCPTGTTVYSLVANHPGGQIERKVTVAVSQPSTPPDIGGSTTSTNQWYDASGCGLTDLNFNVNISGAANAAVFYRILPTDGGTPTAWSSRPLNYVDDNIWARSLSIADMPIANGEMQYYFTAANAAGPASSPAFGNILYSSCKP